MSPDNKNEPKKGNPYLAYIFGAIVLMGVGGTYFLFAQDPVKTAQVKKVETSPVDTARDQLKMLKEGQVDGVYQLVAEPFRAVMPIDKFKEFVKQYAVLATYSSVTFGPPQISGDHASLTAYLHGDGGSIPVQFALIMEGNRWKIAGFIINQGEAATPENLESLRPLFPVVNSQLMAFRSMDLKKGYDNLTAEGFKKTTSFEQFTAFVKSYPILTSQKSATVVDGKIAGDHAMLKVLVTEKENSVPIEYHLVNENGAWKILGIKVLYPPPQQTGLTDEQKRDLMSVVEKQMEAIRQGHIEQAYRDYTTHEFQQLTNFAAFQAFVEEHPLLTHQLAAKLLEGGMQGPVAVINVAFKEDSNVVYITYRLGEEDGRWGIHGMSVKVESLQHHEGLLTTVTPKEVHGHLKELLQELKSGNLEQFYETETSPDFQVASTLEQFKAFLKVHPFLTEEPTIEVLNLKQDGHLVKLDTELGTKNGVEKVVFELDSVNGSWKVSHIEVEKREGGSSTPAKEPDSITMLVGTNSNIQGYVLDPSKHILGTDKPLHVNVYIPDALDKEQVKVVLQHSASQAKTPPAYTEIEGNGNKMASFIFQPPNGGWPPGDYQFLVKTSTNRDSSYQLSIE